MAWRIRASGAIPSVFLRRSRFATELCVKTNCEKGAGSVGGRTFLDDYHDGTSWLGWLGHGAIFPAALPTFDIWLIGILGFTRMERTRSASADLFKHRVQRYLRGSRSMVWRAGSNGTGSADAQTAFERRALFIVPGISLGSRSWRSNRRANVLRLGFEAWINSEKLSHPIAPTNSR